MIHAYNHTFTLVVSIGHIVEKSIHRMEPGAIFNRDVCNIVVTLVLTFLTNIVNVCYVLYFQ